MSNPFKKNVEGKTGLHLTNAKRLTALLFLTTYFESANDFIRYGDGLRDSEVEDLRRFFNYVKLGLRMDGNIQKRSDRSNRTYVYPRFYLPRATPGCKIILEGRMESFIEDIQNGLIVADFTLDDLIVEAGNTN